MKFRVISILLIFVPIIVFSQSEQSIEFSLYGSIPSDFNKQYRQDEFQPRVIDPTYAGGSAGYDLYNTFGSGFTAEYTNKFSDKFAYNLGVDFILHTDYKEAYDKNLAMASSYIRNPYGSNVSYYKSTNYKYYVGFLLAGKYYWGKRSSLFLSVSFNYITFSYHNRINWLNEKIKFWKRGRFSKWWYNYVFYKIGYNYQFSDKLSSFVLIELNDNIYFGLGVKYKLKLK